MNRKSQKSVSKSQKDIPYSWMGPNYSSTTLVFAKLVEFGGVSTKVGLSSN